MITVLTAFIVDFIIGDPHTKLHPVALIGRWISLLERLFYNEKSTKWEHFILGGLTVVITLLFVYNITLVLVLALEFLPNEHWSYIIQGVLLSFMICPRSLAKAGREVYRYLARHHLRIAQLKVGKIVGRDTDHLDSPEVTRATVETIAENTVDGIVSPLFFFAIGGLPLAVVYRAANTLDSMIGVAARVDDVLNYIPARLTGLLFIAVAACLGYDAKGAWRIMRRDASKHPSPNGGYAEATVAGALGIRLGGHNRYFGKDTFREYMGDADHELEPQYIRKTIYLMYGVSLTVGVLTALLSLGLYGLWS